MLFRSAGAEGGQVVAAGTPEAIVAQEMARAARALKKKGTKQGRTKTLANADACSGLGVTTDLVSYTAQALQPVLAAGPYQPRVPYDPEAAEKKRKGDMEIAEIGREAKMPWESDGRGWHTRDRVDRKGNAVKWAGEALARVLGLIPDLGAFSRSDWHALNLAELA